MVTNLQQIINEKQYGFRLALSNVMHVFLRDLKRIFSKPLIAGVLIGALFLPCLYAWLTIAANWDPYGNTKNMKIALVNEDKGVDSAIGGHLTLGDTLEDQLRNNEQLGWTFTDYNDAIRNVENGSFYAAIVLPEDFSANVASIFTDSKNRDFVKLDYYVNERENGAAVKVTDTGASTIEQQINEKFVAKVTEVVASKTVELSAVVAGDMISAAGTFGDRVDRVANDVAGLGRILDKGNLSINQAQTTISKTKDTIISVKEESDRLYEQVEQTKNSCNNLRSKIWEIIGEVGDIETLKDVLLRLESTLSDVSSALSEASGVLYKLSFTCNVVISDLDDASSMLKYTSKASSEFRAQITQLHDILFELSTFIDSNLSNAPKIIKDILNADTNSLGNFISKPVNLESTVLNKIDNNGTAISPFFTNLAIWVLGIVLIALFRTEVEPPKRRGWSAKQAYASRGLLFSFAGVLSGAFVAIGNLIMGIQCENPVLYVFSCMLIAFVFVNIIYMLAACFKHVGRAIACILVIMQIPGSSGMFPIQLMPEGFQNIFPFLPFSYGINLLRECIININGLYWFLDIIALAIFFLISFIIGLYAREGLRNINKLFDEELSKNTIMICDNQDHVSSSENAVESIVENLSDNEEAMSVTAALDLVRAKFKKRSMIGLASLIVVPLLLLIIMSIIMCFIEIDINTKLIWMTIWMLSVILIATYVIVIEYKYKQFKRQEKKSLYKAVELSEAKANA